MSVTTQGFAPKDITISGAKNQEITNLALNANIEGSIALQPNIKGIMVRNRNLVDTQLAFISGDTAVKYITLKGGAVLELTGIQFSSETLYALSASASTLEVLELY